MLPACLQKIHGVQATNDVGTSKLVLAQIKNLLAPVYTALYPKGVLAGSVLKRPPYSTGGSPSQPLTAPGPELSALSYQLLEHLGVYVYRDFETLLMLVRVLQHEVTFFGGLTPLGWHVAKQAVNGAKVAQV